MANKKYDDADGVWRTIGGRRVFIRTGQSLSDAMIESGKFKNAKKKDDENIKVKKYPDDKNNDEYIDVKRNLNDIDEKTSITERDAKDLLKQLNDEGSDFTFNEDVVIKDGKLITDVGVMMPEEDGFTSRELQIPLDDVKDYADLEAKLRDWEDRHRSVDDWGNIDFEPKELDSKSVLDSDGFTTDYTLYEMPNGKYKAVFGDKDVYGPDADADMEFDNLKEAQEWFDDYKGFEDEEEYKYGKDIMVKDANGKEVNAYNNIYDMNQKQAQKYVQDLNNQGQLSKEDYDTLKDFVGIEDKTNDDEIVNDDEKSLNYSFRVGDRNIFEVRYDRTGNNKNMDFATSSSELNLRRTDITRGGQAQKDLLPKGSKARAFYDKWDNKHLGTLTQKEYNELVNDIEELKKEYPHIDGDRFSDQVKLDRETKALKKSSGKRFPTNISKDVYEMDVDKGNAWSGNAVQKTANGEQFISVRRNGPSQNSAEDIANNLAKKYPQLNANVVGDDEVKLTLKSTNDAMNNMIKEKASKKSSYKPTADEEDILYRYSKDYGYDSKDNFKNLKGQIDYMRNPNESIHRTAERLVEGGDFLIYNGDIKEWLDARNIKYNDDNFFDKYKKEMADKIENLYNEANGDMNSKIRKKAGKK